MIRRPPRSTQSRSSAASDVYKRQLGDIGELWRSGRLRFRMTRLLSKCRPGRRDASLDAVAFALAPEGCRVDTQARRRLFEGRGFGKGLLDVAAFKVFE